MNKRMKRSTSMTVIASCLLSLTAFDSIETDYALCNKRDANACTRLIESRQFKGDALGSIYAIRALARRAAGRHLDTLEDLNKAIELESFHNAHFKLIKIPSVDI